MYNIRVVFRTDASIQIGTGHVMRCLTLANYLAAKGAMCYFLCRAHTGNLIDLIKENGFQVIELPKLNENDYNLDKDIPHHSHWLNCEWKTDVLHCQNTIPLNIDWLIVDHYALDHKWEKTMRSNCNKIMCIDDLADRNHDCDLLLDQTQGRHFQDYADLIPHKTELLLGPKYALLRPEFRYWREKSLLSRENSKLRHILITMGGVDKDNITTRLLKVLKNCNLEELEKITVVLGPYSPWKELVKSIAALMPVPTEVLSGVKNMANLMANCDLAIGGGGSTTWERCCLGVPTIQIIIAENQRLITEQIQNAGAAVACEANIIEKELCNIINNLKSPKALRKMTIAASAVNDALGAKRISEKIYGR